MARNVHVRFLTILVIVVVTILSACLCGVPEGDFQDKPNGHDEHSDKEESMLGFYGSTMMQIVTINTNSDDVASSNETLHNNHLSFLFRTKRPVGLLAAAFGEPDIAFVLSNGKLAFQFLHHSVKPMSLGSNLHDGNWHTVNLSFNGSHINFHVDGETDSLLVTEIVAYPDEIDWWLTLLGPTGWGSPFNDFIGCMKDVRVRGALHMAQEKANVKLTNISSECKSTYCASSPCQNGGICSDLEGKMDCLCPRPYYGNNCQYSSAPAVFNDEDSPNSLVTVDLPVREVGDEYVVSMIVQTLEARGTLFMFGEKQKGLNGSYVEATIAETGNLVIHARWIDNSDRVMDPQHYSANKIVSDGNKHLISVQVGRRGLIIKVDGMDSFQKLKNVSGSLANVMYIGGKPEHWSEEGPEVPTKNTHSSVEKETTVSEPFRFKGSIQDVRVELRYHVAVLECIMKHKCKSPNAGDFSVDFFSSLEIPYWRPSLGNVTVQNILQGASANDSTRGYAFRDFRG